MTGASPAVAVHARRAGRVVIAVVVLAVCALYVWTATSSTNPQLQPDRYNELVDAWRHGQLDLLQKPSAGFRALPDPLDPAANAPFRATESLLDLSYAHGKLFFSSWGPTPVLVLYLPARWVGGRMDDHTALAVFCLIGFLASSALLVALARRLLDDVPEWMLGVGIALLGLGSLAPFVLRNPGVYQVAQGSGYALAMSGALALTHATLGTRVRIAWLAVGSLLVGLAMGGRFIYVLALGPMAALLVWLVRSGRIGRPRAPAVAAALLGPALACVAALLVYNQQRYGSFTEFGLHYLLNDARPGDQQRFVNIPPNGWYYLFAPLQVGAGFPYALIGSPENYPLTPPARYFKPEYTGGLLPTQPLLIVLAALPLLARRRVTRPVAAFAAGFALLGAGMLVADAFGVPVATQRYELDMAPALLIGALLTWFALATRPGGAGARTAARGLGLVLAVFGCAVGVALSIVGQSDMVLAKSDPETYFDLARRTRLLAPLGGSLHFGAVADQVAIGASILVALAAVGVIAWRLVPGRIARHAWVATAAGAVLVVGALVLGTPDQPTGETRLTTAQGMALAVGAALLAAGWALEGRRRRAAQRPRKKNHQSARQTT